MNYKAFALHLGNKIQEILHANQINQIRMQLRLNSIPYVLPVVSKYFSKTGFIRFYVSSRMLSWNLLIMGTINLNS